MSFEQETPVSPYQWAKLDTHVNQYVKSCQDYSHAILQWKESSPLPGIATHPHSANQKFIQACQELLSIGYQNELIQHRESASDESVVEDAHTLVLKIKSLPDEQSQNLLKPMTEHDIKYSNEATTAFQTHHLSLLFHEHLTSIKALDKQSNFWQNELVKTLKNARSTKQEKVTMQASYRRALEVQLRAVAAYMKDVDPDKEISFAQYRHLSDEQRLDELKNARINIGHLLQPASMDNFDSGEYYSKLSTILASAPVPLSAKEEEFAPIGEWSYLGAAKDLKIANSSKLSLNRKIPLLVLLPLFAVALFYAVMMLQVVGIPVALLYFLYLAAATHVISKAVESVMDAEELEQEAVSSYWKAVETRYHGKEFEGIAHEAYAVHVQAHEDEDYLELVCYRKQGDDVQYSVVQREVLFTDEQMALTQAHDYAAKAQKLESQSWHEAIEAKAHREADEQVQAEMQRTRELRRQSITSAVSTRSLD